MRGGPDAWVAACRQYVKCLHVSPCLGAGAIAAVSRMKRQAPGKHILNRRPRGGACPAGPRSAAMSGGCSRAAVAVRNPPCQALSCGGYA
jgi:hypothetical protein